MRSTCSSISSIASPPQSDHRRPTGRDMRTRSGSLASALKANVAALNPAICSVVADQAACALSSSLGSAGGGGGGGSAGAMRRLRRCAETLVATEADRPRRVFGDDICGAFHLKKTRDGVNTV